MNNRIFWLVAILSAMTIGFSSCAKDTEVEDPYANWKERNDNPIPYYQYKVSDYVYVKYANAEDVYEGTEPLINFTDTVSVAYQGFLINDTRFDGNYYGTFNKEVNDNFTEFDVSDNGYIVGWTTAMIHLKPETSDKVTVYIPYQMGYGESGSGSTIKGYSTLIFELYIDEVIHPYNTNNSDN